MASRIAFLVISLNIRRRIFFLLAAQLFGQVPADRFAFAVRVGRDVDRFRRLGGLLQLLDDLRAVGKDDVSGLEAGVDVDAQLALGQVADVAHRRDDFVVAPQIFVDRLRLRRRLDDDQRLCHDSLLSRSYRHRSVKY